MTISKQPVASGVALANALLTTSPPPVGTDDAMSVMSSYFGGAQRCQALSGERDKNFFVTRQAGDAITLKFINDAETLAETEMQIAVLKHLQQVGPHCAIPQHICSVASQKDWALYPTADGQVRVRAYSFIDGKAGSFLQATPSVWRDIGIVAAQLNQALASFEHAAAHRVFLWDASQILLLKPLLAVVAESDFYSSLIRFMEHFEQVSEPALRKLPKQIVHNDLSPSNMLSDDQGLRVAGILDFGDMVYAPRIIEIAVAASYQMGGVSQPLVVLEEMLAGYGSLVHLSSLERHYVLDLVIARLVQRMVITSWRASQFPCNSTYILRSYEAAKTLFEQLIGPWLQDNKRGVTV